MRSPALKRAFDVAGAAVGLVVAAAPMAVIAVAIAVVMGRPVLFIQERPGRGAQPFRLYKFRTMRDTRDQNGDLLSEDQRLTRLGRFLRAVSLDELPELWNILRGDMSFVGPRPLLMEYLPRYSPEQARRHEVRPGLTGLAQVEGRNSLPWERRFERDVWYVDHWTLWLDLRILLRTVGGVVRRDGISQPGHATAERFRGTGN